MDIPKDIYLLGVGGMGMMPLALYLAQAGHNVVGQDDSLQNYSRDMLIHHGVKLHAGSDVPGNAGMLVYSSAIPSADPRLEEARKRGIPVVRRGELLASLFEGKKLIAVVGSHGKTTTTGILIHVLNKIQFEFDYILGGLFRDNAYLPARYFGSDWVVLEVDESDGTIDAFNPEITIALNIDWDHINYYKSSGALEQTFLALFNRTKDRVFMPTEDGRMVALSGSFDCQTCSFGEGGDFDAKVTHSDFNKTHISLSGQFEEQEFVSSYGGRFNAHNTIAALSVVNHLAGPFPSDAMNDFPGILRRQDVLWDEPGLKIISDYAHHPKELDEMINCIQEGNSSDFILVFQPHRYSRTKQFIEEFSDVLSRSSADHIILLPVYAASEDYDSEGTSERILESLSSKRNVGICREYDEMRYFLNIYMTSDTVILFVGAGDIDVMAHDFVSDRDDRVEGWFEVLKFSLHADTILKKDELLSKKTTLRIGGNARFFAEPANIKDLSLILSSAYRERVPVFILGRGSNLLVFDDGYNGLVIHLRHAAWRDIEELEDGRISVGAGVRLKALSGKTSKMGLTGFEFLEGIPGSVGGALRMNAGAMGNWIFKIVDEIEFVRIDGEVVRMLSEDLNVGYRYCEELKNAVATRAIFKSPNSEEVVAIKAKMKGFSAHRTESQPQEPSAGCTFKNPEGDHAGRIIDELGLKGYCVGNAEVSTVHANFIINRGNASSDDVLDLIRHVRKCAMDERDIDLLPEVQLLGKTWDQVL